MNSPVAFLSFLVFWFCGPSDAIRVPVSYDDPPRSCPGPAPTKVLLCYYEGRLALEKLDPCVCSHLVFTSAATINPNNYTLNLTTDVGKATRELRLQNPELEVLISVGGVRVPTEVVEAMVKSADRRAMFASSIARIVRDADLSGIEINFRLDSKGGSKYSKGGLVALAKLLRKEIDAVKSHRSKRDYSVFEQVDDISTTAWTPPRRFATRGVRKAEPRTRMPHRPILRSTRTDTHSNARETLLQSYLALEHRSSKDKLLLINVPTQPEILVKRFDLKTLAKYVDYFTIPSHNLTDSSENGVTYHPSRLMGLADILNTDSILDLVMGLGAPHNKLIISIPATATQFTLKEVKQNTPRSPITAGPETLTQTELCTLMSAGGWTIERDEDLTAPYAFKNGSWLSFDDRISVGIKSKYVLLRDLAGAALYPVDSADWSGTCLVENSTDSKIPQLLHSLHHAFTSLARKSRGTLLETLQEDIRTSTLLTFTGDVQLSPYRIVRVIDNLGAVHVVRKNARTEFECSRQGYFRHPLSCNRFYRCVKFNQYSEDFTVFEYDCPAGLAFDERWEVCVWPGSLPEGACQGSSEIAPVPRARYTCPKTEGYYADPENCRWFFACLDHTRDGVTPLTAYEFRCPFGLVFDEQNLLCQWPWLVDGCGNSGVFAGAYFGELAFGDAVRRGYAATAGGYKAGGAVTGNIASQKSGSIFVPVSDLGVHSGVGITSSEDAIAVQQGTRLATGDAAGGILFTDTNAGSNVVTSTAYVSGASRGSIKHSSNSAAGGFGGQISGSYIAGGKSSQAFDNSGSFNEGRHISSYASFPDSYVSGGRIENSGGLVLGEHVGVHGTEFGIRSGGTSVISGGQTLNLGNAGLIENIDGSRNIYSSDVIRANKGRYLSGSVLSSVPTKTEIKTPNIPIIPVPTFQKPAAAQIPIIQPTTVPITTYQQTLVETPQAPVIPVTTFRRPAVAKVPIVQPVAQAVPVATYQQTLVETPQAPVIPLTTFRRPAVAKVPIVQPPVAQAVPVATYQQTLVETPQAPVIPLTTFRRPAAAKVPIVQPVAQAVPVATYQQTLVETPQAPVIPLTTFRRPAAAKVPDLQLSTIPVAQNIPVTYQQTIVETPQASAVPIAPDVSLIQHAVTTKPLVRTPTILQTSTVDTAPVTNYFEQTPAVPAVLRRTKLRPVAYQALTIPDTKPLVPVVNTYLSTPASTVLPIQRTFSESGGAGFTVEGDEGEGQSLQGRPVVSVATNGAAGISLPLARSNVETFGAVVTKNTVPVSTAPVIKTGISFGEYSYSTPATGSSVLGSSSYSPSGYFSSTLAPAINSGTATADYSYATPATIISAGKTVSVTPVPDRKSHVSFGSYPFTAIASSVPFAADVRSNVSSVGYSYPSPAPIITNGAISVNVVPTLRPNIEAYSVSRVGIVPGDTVQTVNTRVTPAFEYSYPKSSTLFTSGKTSTFRGVSLASGLEPALSDSSAGLASGLELPSSTVGPVFIDSSVTTRPYASRTGATKLGFALPTFNTEIDKIHKNGYVSSTTAPSVAVTPEIPIFRSYTVNQKALLSTTGAPIHAVPLVDGDFGARTSFQGDKFAASYLGAEVREGFTPQTKLTYGAPPNTQYTSDSAFITSSISDNSQGRGTPYPEYVSGYVSSTTIPATSTSEANNVYSNTQRSNVFQNHNFVSSTPRPVTYLTEVTPKSVKVTSVPVLQPTTDYKTSEEFGSRIGEPASGKKSTSRTHINYDNENVEALLDKYSGKFGGLLDNNKESFISGVITDDLVGHGGGEVSQSGTGYAFERGHVHGVGQSDSHDGYSTTKGHSGKGSITTFGTRAGFTTLPATDSGARNFENIEYSTSRGSYGSTTSSPDTGLRGKVRYGLNVNIDADGGIGYDTVAVRHEGTKSQSKQSPIVVITRLSDINPLLIAKLGAQCTCKSNTVSLKRLDDYPRSSSSGTQSEPLYSTTFDDDINSRSGTYNIPEHIPSAPLPGSNIVTGSSPDIILRLDDETPSTPVRLAPNKFLKAIGLDETGITEAPTVFVASSRPHSKLTEVAYTTAKSAEISSQVPFTKGARLYTSPQIVSNPIEPHVQVSSPISSAANFRSNARPLVPVASSDTTVPVAETAVADFESVAAVSGDYPETGFPDSGVDLGGPTRGSGVRTDGGVPGVGLGAVARAGTGAGRAFDRYGPGGWRGLDETLQGSVDCQRAGLFRHPKYCNKFYACHWDEWKGRYTLHVFNCPVHLAYDSNLGACNWPSKGPTCSDDNLLV
ncbi:uncharacterized protein LOC110834409 [Zootermopsis nevadensis]|uniref:uncharacterized protein LOC110834409 n=1 Tax=Zootermopsis nevadensis TaxID=136037 RepID=UPI000B8E721F|nr:uncharacterized protein LOC110834409 [Zootermopsis nevadensis]